MNTIQKPPSPFVDDGKREGVFSVLKVAEVEVFGGDAGEDFLWQFIH